MIKGRVKKKGFLSLWVLTPPPQKVLDTRPLFENFLKKMFFPFEKSKILRKVFKKEVPQGGVPPIYEKFLWSRIA